MSLERYTFKDLIHNPPPETEWIVPGLIPEGCFIVAGPPKIGKSWWALQLATSVAQGALAFDKFETERGRVFYFALEDSKTRIHKRLLLQGLAQEDDQVEYIHRCPYGEEAVKEIHRLFLECPDTKLVLIDTLEKVRGPRTTANMYEADYQAVGMFQELATEYHKAIGIFHHVRKNTPDNIEEAVSGSFGLTGAADSFFIIHRDVPIDYDAGMFINGRDIERRSFGLTFDDEKFLWSYHDEISSGKMSPIRQAILEAVTKIGIPCKPKNIAEMMYPGGPTEAEYNNIRQTLPDMVKAGQLRQPARGAYCLP